MPTIRSFRALRWAVLACVLIFAGGCGDDGTDTADDDTAGADDALLGLCDELCEQQAAEEEEKTFYAGRASDEWLGALEPIGTNESKPHLTIAAR